MRNKIQSRLKSIKFNKRIVIRFLPLLVFLTLFILGVSLGIAGPTTPPPGPQ
jgi:hypothetical protein